MSEIEVAAEVEEALHNPPKDAASEKPYPNQLYALPDNLSWFYNAEKYL